VATALKKPRRFSSYTRSAQRAGLLQTAAINAEEAARRIRFDAGVIDFWWCLTQSVKYWSTRTCWAITSRYGYIAGECV
jgi:hypothetical protein